MNWPRYPDKPDPRDCRSREEYDYYLGQWEDMIRHIGSQQYAIDPRQFTKQYIGDLGPIATPAKPAPNKKLLLLEKL